MYSSEAHGSLQVAEAVQTQLLGILTARPLDGFRGGAGRRASRPTSCSPSASRSPCAPCPTPPGSTLRASLVDLATGRPAGDVVLARDADEVHTGELPPLPPGDYRLRVEGVGVSAPLVDPVHALLCVVDDAPTRRRAADDVTPTRCSSASTRTSRRSHRCTAAATTSPPSRRTCAPAPTASWSCGCCSTPRQPATRSSPAFREHLGRAGDGDVALFAYCGHGSEEPAPAAIADLEPSGRIQTIVLHDCGRRVDGKLRRALADKELVAADRRGRGGRRPRRGDPRLLPLRRRHPRPVRPAAGVDAATRRRRRRPTATSCRAGRGAPVHRVPARRPRPLAGAAPAARRAGRLPLRRDGQGAPRRRRQPRRLLGRPARLARRARRPHDVPLAAGDRAVARRAHRRRAAARSCSRWRWAASATRLFLDGAVRPGRADVHGRRRRVPAGRSTPGSSTGCVTPSATRPSSSPAATTTARRPGWSGCAHVEVGRSVVEPVEWTPADRAYRAVVVAVPLPPAEVQLDPPVDGGPSAAEVAAVHDAVRAAVATAGAGRDAVAVGARRRRRRRRRPARCDCAWRSRRRGTARIARADGAPVVGDVAEADGRRGAARRQPAGAHRRGGSSSGRSATTRRRSPTSSRSTCSSAGRARPATRRSARRSPPTAAAC